MAARILWYGDSPTTTTGLGKVALYMGQGLKAAGHEVVYLAIGYHGIPHELPFEVNPAWVPTPHDQDIRGRRTLPTFLRTQEHFDVVVINLDHFMLTAPDAAKQKPFIHDIILAAKQTKTRVILYSPIDGPMAPEWVMPFRLADVPVTYTQYGIDQLHRFDPNIATRTLLAGHGVNFDTFHPKKGEGSEALRKQILQPGKSILGLAIAANNTRKDWFRTFQIAAEVLKVRQDVAFLCWTDPRTRVDTFEDLLGAPQALGMTIGRDVVFPQPQQLRQAPEEFIGDLYRAADFHLSTSSGEGWGLGAFEAMACGCPNVLPRVAAWEMIPKGCCQEIRAGGTPDLARVFPHISDLPRPICSVVDGASKVLDLLGSPERQADIRTSALIWVKQWTWERAQGEMVKAVDRALSIR